MLRAHVTVTWAYKPLAPGTEHLCHLPWRGFRINAEMNASGEIIPHLDACQNGLDTWRDPRQHIEYSLCLRPSHALCQAPGEDLQIAQGAAVPHLGPAQMILMGQGVRDQLLAQRGPKVSRLHANVHNHFLLRRRLTEQRL